MERLVERSEAVFERLSPYPGPAFRHHCLRLYELAVALMRRRGVAFPTPLAYAIAMTHDLGLVARAPGRDYVERSLAILFELCPPVEIERAGASVRDVAEAVLLNHRVRPVAGAGPIAECFRRAVWIEHSRGWVRSGELEAPEVAAVFARWPRGALDRVLVDFARRTLTREPASLADGVFLGPAAGAAVARAAERLGFPAR